ncbi:zinc-binding dehydrogenase [Tateyamaria sp. SN3-11]|uniref:zinc-binding dehydrogenase n=1 Tax=Tateyamaria sp. SN3-11 TaxID=3092147 RepID=UPI0039EBD3BE
MKMRAVIAETPGDVNVLKLMEVDIPDPSDGEVRIRVRARGLNRAESYNRQGKHGPFSGKWALGIEAVGEIDIDPNGVWPKGQKVATAMGGMMFDRHGSYADYICVKRENVVPISSALDFETLATLPEAYLTAWGALDKRMCLSEGDILLIRGTTTGIGLAALTYAKHKGATVVATTRNPDREQRLRELGADFVVIDGGTISETVREHVPGGVDKAIELVGAVTVLDTLNSIRTWGEAAFVGFVGGPPVLENFHLMNDLPNTVRLSFFGSGILGKSGLPLSDAPLDEIANSISDRDMMHIKAASFRLAEIREAHRLMESNEAFGKIVVTE